ncbi:hypothetical protein LCGC14_0018480 [marine sediment metagenome]|uniref:HAMP domain-containing protein n=1 Tax=marine sediment metagenome TaxID=412755 RepID=A0A0F9YGL4_9ZZZZ|nr:HAMP domain-containing protein [Phycisphaerae bacterium]HDZ44939.1 HAMP domain-containing protein [Phycisphaerae bacterium]
MKIRWKLLILLLAIALVPLIASTVMYNQLTRHLGRNLSNERREILERNARATLRHVVGKYDAIIQRDKRLVELSVEIQAREVEQRLASPPRARPLIYTQQFDKQRDLPADTALSPVHLDFDSDSGKQIPMLVAYSNQAYLVVEGVEERDVADDMMRLSTMPEVYRGLRKTFFYAVKWQYTSLETGFHTTYPAHGGYANDYDHRKRKWYTKARDAGQFRWEVITDVTTGVMTLAATKPVYGPEGEFAGVTAVDVPQSAMLYGLDLPVQWGDAAVGAFVAIGKEGAEDEGKPVILAQASEIGRQRDWRKPVEVSILSSDDPEQLAQLVADAQAGRPGVRRMPYRGRDALWAYSSVVEKDGGFAVVIVPYETIMAPAVQAQQHVWAGIVKGLQLAALGLAFVVIVVTVVAARASRAVTQPIRELSKAAADLAAGDYDARADVTCCDEIGDLAEIFNDMGPKLREREKMKQSLALAMEIQQHLLPQESPHLEHFDVAGKSIYCDETGGDYYDFIDLLELGPGKIGIAVGDVSGHGIGAALLMASARAVLRSHAGRLGGDLSELFATLNRHLVRDTGDARFMTLFYGILDDAARSLRWTSGGHDPAIWLRCSTGLFEEMPNTGIPLGVLEGMTFGEGGPVTLEAGDVVVIGTDGIWEAANEAGDMFGKDRLREIIGANADKPARYIYATVVDAVNEFLGAAPQLDDVTLVVIKAL